VGWCFWVGRCSVDGETFMLDGYLGNFWKGWVEYAVLLVALGWPVLGSGMDSRSAKNR